MSSPSKPVDLSTAPISELQTLPGIGPKKAALIQQNQPFESFAALSSIDGVGRKMAKDLEGSPGVFLTPTKNTSSPSKPKFVPTPPVPLEGSPGVIPTKNRPRPPKNPLPVPREPVISTPGAQHSGGTPFMWVVLGVCVSAWAQHTYSSAVYAGLQSQVAALTAERDGLRERCAVPEHSGQGYMHSSILLIAGSIIVSWVALFLIVIWLLRNRQAPIAYPVLEADVIPDLNGSEQPFDPSELPRDALVKCKGHAPATIQEEELDDEVDEELEEPDVGSGLSGSEDRG